MYLYYKLSENLVYAPHHDSNGSSTLTKLNSAADYSSLPYTSNWSTQSLSANQTNTLTSSSSSQSHRNFTERQEQQQHSNQSRNNARPHQTRTSKKRKQSQQQETIRTELIPGHRGDRDVDELVSFIDGSASKQRQNSSTSHSVDAHKSKVNATNDANSNKSAIRKKSRKPTKTSQPATTDEALGAEESASNEQLVQPKSPLDDEDNPSADSSVDLADHSFVEQSTSPTVNHLDSTNVPPSEDASASNPTKMSNGKTSLPDWFEQTRETLAQNDDDDDDDSSFHSSLTLTNNSNSELISEPFVTVTHRRRVTKERRQDNHSYFPRSSRFPPAPATAAPPSSSSNAIDKRRVPSALQNGTQRSAPQQQQQQHPFSHKVFSPSVPKDESNTRNSNNHSMPAEPPSQPTPPTSVTQPISSEPNLDKRQSSPRLSSHSSSSSLSSLVKRQPKPPPVVFLNKSVDVELNDVSFGFDLDTATLSKPADETQPEPSPSANESHPEPALAPAPTTTNESVPPAERPTRKSQQRNRGAQFYSGPDIRPHHHRPFPSQPMSAQSSYIDPLLLLQYNQQRLASFQHPFTYMNFVRAPFVSSQSPYVLLPTAYPTAAPGNAAAPTASATSENEGDEATNQTPSEQAVEPPVVFATPTGPLYYQPHPLAAKKPFLDSDQVPLAPVPTMYATAPALYPPTYFYPPQAPHLIASHPAYFQPITSPSLLVEGKADSHDADEDFESVGKPYGQARPQASSDIMSSALQLVYSQQRRNAQTDRFNLDDLTAYLAMKWTETVDNYEQGDNRIVLVGEQS